MNLISNKILALHLRILIPANIYLFKVNNGNSRNTRKAWNMFKANNKNTRTTSSTSFWCFYCNLLTYFTIVDFEQVNFNRETSVLNKSWWICTSRKTNSRSSHPDFYQKMCFYEFCKIHIKSPAPESFLPPACNYWKLWHGWLSINFEKFHRQPPVFCRTLTNGCVYTSKLSL